jgi:hypothetical protein
MLWLGDWELCQKLDCRSRSVSFANNPFQARQWLQHSKADVSKMLAMRNVLLQEHIGLDPFRMSDDEVINQIAALLASDRLHIHVASMIQTTAPTLSQVSPVAVRQKQAAAPPPRKAVSMDDPPTLPSDVDFAAQAAALVAAASSGAAFCTTCHKS